MVRHTSDEARGALPREVGGKRVGKEALIHRLAVVKWQMLGKYPQNVKSRPLKGIAGT